MSRKRGLAGVALVLALDCRVEAFTTLTCNGRCAVSRPASSRQSVAMSTTRLEDPVASPLARSNGEGRGDRRDFLTSAAASLSAGLGLGLLTPLVSSATVNFETERYGDKELKIATVNKLRQQLRNTPVLRASLTSEIVLALRLQLLDDPGLAPAMLKLALADALGFDAATETGGLDGSVVFEMNREVSKGLQPALDAAIKIKRNLQRTNEMTLGDILAYGGAEAIISVGGPAISVQLGRYDEKKNANPSPEIAGFNFETPTAAGLKAAFKRAGLGAREMVLMLGALGSVTDVTIAIKNGTADEDDDDLDDVSWQNTIPSTFGKESDKLGKALGSGFGSGYLQRVVGSGREIGAVGAVLLDDDEVKTFAKKYAVNTKAFLQDVSEAYTKITRLGERYETRSS